jgi:hypothetical protein
MTVNIRSSSSAAYRKGFHIHNLLTEPDISSPYGVSVRFCIIESVFIEAVLKCMFKYLKNYEIVERGDGSYDSTSLFLYIRQLL